MPAVTASDPTLAERNRLLRNRALVRWWLYLVLFTIFLVVIVGGATRLTESGLSITEWKPIHGVIPPLNEAEWQEEFAKYKQIPQYTQLNADMDLSGFKRIFWWEWAHRLLARWAGVIFYALPFAFFWATGKLERGLPAKLGGIFALGILQGAVGWLMVTSGFEAGRTSVSPLWLAAHLTIAALIFTATMLVARGLAPHTAPPATRSTQRFAGILVLLVLFQIYLGGLVAGIDAGLSYNTWPLMDGSMIPGDLFVIEPAWRNLIENPKTVQFIHRLGAYILFAAALWHMIVVRRTEPGTTHSRRALVLFHLVLLQAVFGIVALLTQVQLHAALMHQGMALIVLGFAAAHWRGTKGSYPLPVDATKAG